MRRLLSATLALACAVIPARAEVMTLMGVGGSDVNIAHAYSMPSPTSYFIAFGDSITAHSNDFGSQFVGTTWTSQISMGNGYPGWIPTASGSFSGGNLLITESGWNYGVDSQTTAGFLGRQANTGTDCNIQYNLSFPCFTGQLITFSSTVGAGSAAGTNLPYSASKVYGGATVDPTQYEVLLAGVTLLHGTITNIPAGSIQVNQAIANAISPGSVTVSMTYDGTTSSHASEYWLYLDGTNQGEQQDIQNNVNAGGYSSCSDPAVPVFYNAGGNDTVGFGPGIQKMLTNVALLLDNWGPSWSGGSMHCNHVVVLGSEFPRGLATGTQFGGPYFVTPSATTFTVPNSLSGTFWDTTQIFYTPATTTTSGTGSCTTSSCPVATVVAGTKDGQVLTSVGTVTTTGQWSQSNSAVGTYTINSGDEVPLAVDYRYLIASDGPAPNQLTILHQYLASSSRDFHYTFSGTDHDSGIPGALYRRPWVVGADTWTPTRDASISGYDFDAPYMTADGIHPTHLSGLLMSRAMVAAAKTKGVVPSTTPYPISTVNNTYFTGYLNSSGSVTVSPACQATIGSNDTAKNHWITILSPSAVTYPTLYTTTGPIISGIAQIGAAWTTPTPIDCVDIVNNQLHMSQSPTAHVTNNAIGGALKFMQQNDANSFLPNGVFSAGANATYSLSNCTVGGVNWCFGPSSIVAPTFTGNVSACSTPPCRITGLTLGSGQSYPGATLTSGLTAWSGSAHLLNAFISGSGATGNWTVDIDKATTAKTSDTLTGTMPVIADSAIPNGWSLNLSGLGGGSAVLTTGACASTPCSGTAGFGYGIETNPFGDGVNDIVFVFEGYTGTGNLSYQLFAPTIEPYAYAFEQITQILSQVDTRAQCQVLVSPGPNGHLTGISSAGTTLAMYPVLGDSLTAAPFAVPGFQGATFLAENAAAGGSNGGIEFSDGNAALPMNAGDLAAVSMDLLTPLSKGSLTPAYAAGSSGNKMIFYTGGGASLNAPVSAIVRYRNCGLYPANNG